MEQFRALRKTRHDKQMANSEPSSKSVGALINTTNKGGSLDPIVRVCRW